MSAMFIKITYKEYFMKVSIVCFK